LSGSAIEKLKEAKGIVIAAVALSSALGSSGVYEWYEVQKANAMAAELVKFYAPKLGTCELELVERRRICLEQIEKWEEQSAHWRGLCGR